MNLAKLQAELKARWAREQDVELAAVREINAHLPFADPIMLARLDFFFDTDEDGFAMDDALLMKLRWLYGGSIVKTGSRTGRSKVVDQILYFDPNA